MRDLFGQNGPGTSFQYDHKESKASYNISPKKKNRAPPPPSGLSQYRPKILTTDSHAPGIVAIHHEGGQLLTSPSGNNEVASLPVRPPRLGKGQSSADSTANGGVNSSSPFIIGDKDVPMVLHAPDEDLSGDQERDIGDRQRLTSVDGMPGYESQGTENPLFRMQDGEEEEERMDTGEGSRASDSYDVAGDWDRVYQNGDIHHPAKISDHRDKLNGVYIPDPDYDEDEKTLVLEDEDGDLDLHLNPEDRGQKVYKEYHGEDFAQYLSDEDAPRDMLQTLKRPSHSRSHNHLADRKSKTEAQRPHFKKRDSVFSQGGAGKGKNRERNSISGSHSLRDFSFNDSKFGTVTGGNNHKRHSLSLTSSHDSASEEAEIFVETGNSYEQFLRHRNGQVPADGVGDNRSELVDAAHGLPEAPPRYARASGSRDSLWKKMTWKFKSKVRSDFNVSS